MERRCGAETSDGRGSCAWPTYGMWHDTRRSAVLREASADFLARKDAEEVDRRYEADYGGTPSIDDVLEGWSAEGVWPDP